VKTAISIPDSLFEAADKLAKRLGISRSKLYSTAVAEYVAHHHAETITGRLDEVYQEEPAALDPVLEILQTASIPEEDW